MKEKMGKIVEMDQMMFSEDPDVSLTAHGISTSIVFATMGSYYKNGHLIDFCGLYYWSGFDANEEKPNETAGLLLFSFFDGLRVQLDLEDAQQVLLKEIHFVGGEKPYYENGELLSSGTVREVEALRKAVDAFDFFEEGVSIHPNNIHYESYLTSNEESLQLEITPQKMRYEYDYTNESIFADIEAEIDAGANPFFSYK